MKKFMDGKKLWVVIEDGDLFSTKDLKAHLAAMRLLLGECQVSIRGNWYNGPFDKGDSLHLNQPVGVVSIGSKYLILATGDTVEVIEKQAGRSSTGVDTIWITPVTERAGHAMNIARDMGRSETYSI